MNSGHLPPAPELHSSAVPMPLLRQGWLSTWGTWCGDSSDKGEPSSKIAKGYFPVFLPRNFLLFLILLSLSKPPHIYKGIIFQ